MGSQECPASRKPSHSPRLLPPHEETEREEDSPSVEGGDDTDVESLESVSGTDSEDEDEDDSPGSRRCEPVESRQNCVWSAARYCLRAVWAVGSRCIIFDFTFGYVWSRFLAFATFVLVVMNFAERSFDEILILPSSSRCQVARAIEPCCRNGHPRDIDPPRLIQIPMDPFEEGATLHLDEPGQADVVLAAGVSLVNSRYLSGSRCLACILVPLASCSSAFYTLWRLRDLFSCGSGHGTVDWTPYMPGGRATWTFPSPSSDGIEVAEYCSVLDDGEIPLRTTLGNSVKNFWAAWMPAAEFEVRIANMSDMLRYCGQVGKQIAACVQWLNSSLLGNSLDCNDTKLDLATVMKALDGAGLHSAKVRRSLDWSGPALAQIVQAAHIVQAEAFADDHKPTAGSILGMIPLQCVARVSGANFRLGHVDNSSAVAFHLLSLASRGVKCPSAWGLDGRGAEQAPGSAEQCAFSSDFLRLDPEGLGGPRLRPLNGSEAYLQEDFFHCVVEGVVDCSMRMLAAGRTTFRSASGAICRFVVFCGLVWSIYLRFSTRPWQPWSEVPEGAARILRICLSSRVMWGYSVASLLQLGFFVMELEAWPVLSKELPKGAPYALLYELALMAFTSQTLIALAAIALNVVKYFGLRRQIMELPGGAIFGEDPAPPDYRGPDLADLREMGSSSVLYAMYFPGIVFWRFFFGSWILALMLAMLVGLFLVALDPLWRGPFSESVWRCLSSMLFGLSILLAHYLTRLYTQRCLMRQDARGMRLRCVCLFAWWELLTCILGLALGPFTTLYDFLKSLIATTLSSLIVEKPNFIQFGELSDYVYCTYCASLYLERVAEDHRAGSEELGEEDVSLAEPGYRRTCPVRCCGCVLIFLGVPSFTTLLLNIISVQYDYPCQESRVVPTWFCKRVFLRAPE